MTRIRSLALKLLTAVVRRTPSHSQEWAGAMLRELDFIESDWAALFWALGSTTAIFKHAGRGLMKKMMNNLGKHSGEKGNSMDNKPMNNKIGAKASGIAAGILIALGVAVSGFGIVWLLFYLFPKWDLGPFPWWVGVIVIPEIIFLVAILRLWQKRRPMAVGILLSAIVLATHFLIHVANHFSNH
jgi:hypothetical protein